MYNLDDFVKNFLSSSGPQHLQFLVANVPKVEDKTADTGTEFSLDKLTIRRALEDNHNNYMMLLLYRKEDVKVMIRFFETYGAKVNNFLGGDINLYTVYSREIYKKWSNIKGSEVLDEQNFFEEDDGFNPMLKLAHYLNISSFDGLPALIIVNKKDVAQYASITIKDMTATEISDVITRAKNIIDSNYDDFQGICRSFNVQGIQSDALAQYVKKIDINALIEKYKKKIKTNYDIVANNLGISERTLRRKRQEPLKYMSRDDMIAIALVMGISVEDTNDALDAINTIPLRSSNIRDDTVIKELRNGHGTTLYRINNILKSMNLQEIKLKNE